MCYRLYSADEFAELIDFTPPEILRAPLQPTALQLLALGVRCVSAALHWHQQRRCERRCNVLQCNIQYRKDDKTTKAPL